MSVRVQYYILVLTNQLWKEVRPLCSFQVWERDCTRPTCKRGNEVRLGTDKTRTRSADRRSGLPDPRNRSCAGTHDEGIVLQERFWRAWLLPMVLTLYEACYKYWGSGSLSANSASSHNLVVFLVVVIMVHVHISLDRNESFELVCKSV